MLRTASSRLVSRRIAHQVRRASTTNVIDRDVVIVGGGPAGLALAGALGSSKIVQDRLSISLIEAGDLSKVRNWTLPPGTFSNRVVSITNNSRAFLQDIGAWSFVDETRTRSVEDMQVWDGVSDARITFSASEMPLQPCTELSRLTENFNLQRALLNLLSTISQVELLDNLKVQSITQDVQEGANPWPLIHLSDGRVIRARLLVGADGFNSPVRTYAGITNYGWAYDTHAIVATMNHAPRSAFQAPNTVAYQRFLPTGPIAFLPLSDTVSSLVWSTKPQLAAALKAVEPSVLASMINAAYRLPETSINYLYERILDAQSAGTPITAGEVQEEIAFRERSHQIDSHSAYSSLAVGNSGGIPPQDADEVPPLVTSLQPNTVASFPLRFSHADTYIGEGMGARTVLVGDAAHTTHPLAGQGLNLGLADVEALTKSIESAILRGGDVGSYTALLPYARSRYFENHKLLSAVDKLHKLYSTTAEPVVWARSVGLEVLNELDTIKAALMVSAGSERKEGLPQVGWEVAAKGVETFAKGVDAVRALGGAAGNVAGAAVQQLFKAASGSRNQN